MDFRHRIGIAMNQLIRVLLCFSFLKLIIVTSYAKCNHMFFFLFVFVSCKRNIPFDGYKVQESIEYVLNLL